MRLPGGFAMLQYMGENRIRQGDRVRVKKGTLVRSMHPQKPNDWYPFGATRIIKVFSEPIPGLGDDAEIVWPGSGGYWMYAKAKDVEKVED